MIEKPQRSQEFLPLMVELVRLYEPKVYVELGVHNGYTFNKIAPLVQRAIAIDIKTPAIYMWPHVEFYETTSYGFVKQWNPKDKIDLLFIDANHDENAVMQDFDLLAPLVTEGTGLIILHDTHPVKKELFVPGACGTAYRAAWKIRTEPEYRWQYEILTLPGPWAGASLIRRSTTQLCWEEP